MKNLLLIALILVIGLSQTNAQTTNTAATTQTTVVNPNAPKAKWEKTVNDFGDIDQGIPKEAEFKLTNDEYDKKRQLKAKSNSIRMEKTTERIAKGNELYALVAKYCNMGKLVYENINSPKYKAYLIYKDHKVKKKND